MKNPRVEINLTRLRQNVDAIVGLCADHGISVAGVTKAFCAMPELAQVFVDGGCRYLADSRLENLKKLKGMSLPRMMLRLPMISEAREVVRYADISLNSEVDTIRALDQAAQEAGVRHGVLLMMDLGDLREGFYDEYELFDAIEQTRSLSHIDVVGVGVNLTCFGGVIPDEYNLFRLVTIAKYVHKKYGLEMELISGGNSSSLHLILDDAMVEGINNLRIGEAFLLGRETAYGERVPGTVEGVFTLVAEVIELKKKPTVPKGMVGKNAFGEVPEFEDLGTRTLAICAIGKQDVDPTKLTPQDEDILIKGASSDHIVLDLTDSAIPYRVGSEIRFDMTYGGILSSMTSNYVHKEIVWEEAEAQEEFQLKVVR